MSPDVVVERNVVVVSPDVVVERNVVVACDVVANFEAGDLFFSLPKMFDEPWKRFCLPNTMPACRGGAWSRLPTGDPVEWWLAGVASFEASRSTVPLAVPCGGGSLVWP